jgi:hypothetical protein
MTLVIATLSTLASLHLAGWSDKIAASDLPPSVAPLMTLSQAAPALAKPVPGERAPLTGTMPLAIGAEGAVKPLPQTRG